MSIAHEGIHAMFDDSFKNKENSIFLYKKIDIKRLMQERTKIDIIHNHFCAINMIEIFKLCYIEEVIAHLETKLWALEFFLKNCDNVPKKKKNFAFYEKIFMCEINRRNYLKQIEQEHRTNYDKELGKINYKVFEDKIITGLNAPKIEYINSNAVGHFNAQLQVYSNIHNSLHINNRQENIDKFNSNLFKA